MNLKLIACNVFQREACLCLASTPHLVDPEFIELGAHVNPARLRARLQERIDAIDQGPVAYDALMLLYGVCGNAGVGLQARRFPLVIPRAHDCATILLGSRGRFLEVFGDNPSRPFSSVGYQERGVESYRAEGGVWDNAGNTYEEYVEKYGEDNASYLWQTLHPPCADKTAIYIEMPEVSRPGVEERVQDRLNSEGFAMKREPGSLNLIRNLIHGVWNDDEVLIVPPGQVTRGVYDMERILVADSDPDTVHESGRPAFAQALRQGMRDRRNS